MEGMVFVWLFVIVAAILVEASTVSLVSIWFVPSACIAMILALCGVKLWIQLTVFFVVFILLMLILKPIFKKNIGLKIVPTNADALIGMQAVVIEPIDNLHAKGQVRVRGQVWTARSSDGDVTFEEGQTVNIVKIEGVKLICSQPSKT
ncbi:MAG: NfeD family protein [Clostridia bacterium]|nr:NfeD family protein [Clostridia bacterium]